MVGDLVDAIVGHVRDGHAELGGSIDGYVVDANAEPANGHAVGSGLQHCRRDLRETGHDGVDVPGERYESVLAAVWGDDGFGVSLFPEDCLLWLCGGPYVVGYEYLEC